MSATYEISIHSTTRVETGCAFPHEPVKIDFNPLHHEGGDEEGVSMSATYEISIHSTTRVETGCAFPHEPVKIDFNPLHHEGGDLFRFSP